MPAVLLRLTFSIRDGLKGTDNLPMGILRAFVEGILDYTTTLMGQLVAFVPFP